MTISASPIPKESGSQDNSPRGSEVSTNKIPIGKTQLNRLLKLTLRSSLVGGPIQVVKDATGTAMYGVRGVNGVIVIKTKKPVQ